MSPKGYSKIVFASFIAIFLTLSIAALAQFADYPPGAVLPGGGVAPPPPSYVEPTSQPGPIYVSPTGFITGGGPTGFQIASQPVTQQLGTCAKLPFSTLCSQTQAVDFGQEYTVSKIKFEARPGGSTPPCGATTVTFTGYGKDLIFPTIIQPVSSSAQNWGSAEISVNNLKVQRVIASVTSGCQYLDDIKVTLTPSTITTLTLTAGLTTPNSVQLSWNSYPGAVDYVPQYRSAVLPIGWADAPRVISTSTTISGLSSNTNYEFRVIAMGRILNIIPTQLAESNIVARQTLPFVFTLTAGTATATSVPLSWNSISGATEYLPQYRGAGTTSWSNAPLVTTTSTTIGGLATGNSYDFKVIAIATVFGVKIPFAESNVVPKTASAPPAADTTKPTVSVSRNPSAPKVGDKVTLSATASDASGIGELAIYYGTTATSLIKQVGTPGGSASATVTPPTAGTYYYLANATDKASPVNIGRDPATGTKSFTVSAATPITYQLTVSKSGTGTGTVTATGINCGADCSESYNFGTSVTLTTSPSSGSTFAGWSGACTGTSTTCTVTMNAAKTATATFSTTTTTQYALTVTKPGTGSGTITSSPTGISCGTDCSGTYNSGTVVTLTATPFSGSTFTGWNYCASITETSCTVTMNSIKSVNAHFVSPSVTTYSLTVLKAGTGSGTVTSSPQGINCGTTDCSENYNSGTNVLLTANPSSGSTFAGWSGACTGTSTCQLSMTAAKSVTASFSTTTTTQYALTVSKSGTGTGTVTGTGINCGNDCSQSYNSGTQVELTATSLEGSTFGGFSGAGCVLVTSLITRKCTVSMDAAKTVAANFISPIPSIPSIGTSTTVNLGSGWNLISIPGDFSTATTTCSGITIYFFDANTQQYSNAKTFDGVKDSTADKQVGKKTSWWAYAPSACSITYTVAIYQSYSGIPVKQGWNFLPITNDMSGKKLDNIKGSCDITVAYRFNTASNNWVSLPLTANFGNTDRFNGIVAYSNNACTLGGSTSTGSAAGSSSVEHTDGN